jgi:hypothetical protein
MADVFISWGSPDRTIADEVAKRLRALPDVRAFISLRDMSPGAIITKQVIDEIEAARVALFLISAKSIDRDWIAREISYCVSAYHRKDAALAHIVPVAIGPLDLTLVPRELTELNLHFHEIRAPYQESDLRRLTTTVQSLLGLSTPLVIKAALAAMTDKQFEKIPSPSATWDSMLQLCRRFSGPISETNLRKKLECRYGANVANFTPFGGDTLIELFHRVLISSNAERATRRLSPIFLEWCHDRLFSGAATAVERQAWSDESSLLVVDSVSACHPDVNDFIRDLPQPRWRDRAAVLWIPPYTQYSSQLESDLDSATRDPRVIGDAYQRFRNRQVSRRWLSFDLSTPASLADWIHRVFQAHGNDDEPDRDVLDSVQRAQPAAAVGPPFYGASG